MLNNIIGTIEFCVYHLLLVIASKVSKIQPVGETYKRQDELLRRYLAAMSEVRILKGELVRAKGKNPRPTLRLRCAQALAYVFTRGDKIYHDSYLSTTRATARNWAYKFRHPFKSKKKKNPGGRPKVTEEIVELILALKKENKQWGSKRIRDELLKLGIRLARNTITNILKEHGLYPTGDKSKWEQWKGEFRDHMWACDFFFVETVKGLTCMVYVLVDTYTREILALRVHEGRKDIDSYWVAGTITKVFKELKRQPENLIHDRDPLFMGQVTRLCAVAEIKELKVPPQYPVMDCYAERTIQSIRFELTNHIKARDGTELQKLLDEYKLWFNNHRPHQGIGGKIPQNFSEGIDHPEQISIAQLRKKKLQKITFANGLLHSFALVDDLKKAA
ncbi:MAG: integrase core domain-containing protein [Nitrospinota bacterium]